MIYVLGSNYQLQIKFVNIFMAMNLLIWRVHFLIFPKPLIRFSTKIPILNKKHLDYGDMIYDQTYNASFHRKLESFQYSACLVITSTIRGTPYEKLNQELGLETLQSRQWFRKLCLLHKSVNNQSPSYLFDYIPSTDRIYNTKNAANVSRIKSKQ